MRFIAESVLLLLVVGRSASQGQIDQQFRPTSRIISYKNENYGADGYEFSYETDDHTTREEKGSFVDGIWTVTGKIIWWETNGIQHALEFVADDKGYKIVMMTSGLPAPLGGGTSFGGGYSPESQASLLGANLVQKSNKTGKFKKIMNKNEK